MKAKQVSYIIGVVLMCAYLAYYLLSVRGEWAVWSFSPHEYLTRLYPLANPAKLTTHYYDHLDYYWFPSRLPPNSVRAAQDPSQPSRYGLFVCLSWMTGCSNVEGGGIVRNLYHSRSPNTFIYRNGAPDNHYVEVYHGGWYYEPGIYYYVIKGTGVFLNVGHTLVVHNKLAALRKLGLSDEQILERSGKFIVNGDYVDSFRFIQQYTEQNKLTFNAALSRILDKAIDGSDYRFNRINDSAGYDYSLYLLGKKQGYDTIQFTIQPNDNGGWAYEIMDLRPGLDKSLKQKWINNQKRLSSRDPFNPESKGIPCHYPIPFQTLKCK